VRRVLLAQLRTHAARLIASTLAVVIATGFVVATLVLNETSRATIYQAVGAQYVHTAAVITANGGTTIDPSGLGDLDSVSAVAPTWETSVQAAVPGRTGAQYLLVDSIADDPALRWQQLSAGSLPDRPGEIAVSDRARAAVGDVLTVTTYDDEGTTVTGEATVTGILDLGGDPTAGLFARGAVVPEQAEEWGAWTPDEVRVAAAPGFSDREVADDLAAALAGQDVTVRTGTEEAEHAAAALTGNSSALAAVLLVFGTVAVVVAGLVIANTFAVLLAQRTRELALLRCVGATARQVRRSVLGEALVTGLASSALGVAAGIGLAALVSALTGTDSPIPLAGVSVPLYAVLAGLAVGTLVTLLAALAPARAATRVAPLAALRPVDAAPLRSKSGLLRLLLGLALLLPGAGLLALGVLVNSVLVAQPGGVASFRGVVRSAQHAEPLVVAAAGRLAGRLGGVPAKLAAGNATRNPRRTAATATALLIGVTLTSAMVVGAASTRATATAGLAAAYPTDVQIRAGEPLPAGLLGDLAAVDGVAGGTALAAAQVTGPDGSEWQVEGVDPATATPVLRSTTQLVLPRDGQVVLPEWLADSWSVRAGDQVDLTTDDGSLAATVVVVGSNDTYDPLVTTTDLHRLTPQTTIGELWLRLADADPEEQTATVDTVTDLVGTAAPTAMVSGLVSERAAIDSVLDTLLLVVTGLLGVAVVIALIGVGNTLALSVVERRQENGLLRALGLTRGQLRGLLAWEAVLVAGVAAVLGVVLGGAYGLIGAASVLGGLGEVVLAVPWLQVLAIVAVATLAGLLASVLPARRAARTAPVAAIAAV
jgi:putative ABC transport system permease protein